MRTRTRVRKAEAEGQVSVLTDIEVEEVSVVERAANARKFLLLKADEESAKPAAKEPEAPALKISKEARAELAKLLKGALEAIELIGNQLAGAELAEGAGLPEATSKALAELRKMFAEPAAPAAEAKEPAAKAGAKISASRLARLETAREAAASHLALLEEVLTEVRPAQAEGGEAEAEKSGGDEGEDPPAAAGSQQDPKKKRPAAKAELPAELVDTLKDVGAALKALAKRTDEQAQELADLRKAADEKPARGASRQTDREERDGVSKGEAVSWPLDMNRPISRASTPVEKSFYGD